MIWGAPLAGGKSNIFFSKVNLGPSKKKVAEIRGVFSFGGTLAWIPSPKRPLPPKKTTAGSASGRRLMRLEPGSHYRTQF